MAIAHRLFFGLMPSLWARVVIGGMRDAEGDVATPVANDRLHVTAAISDDYDHFPHAVADRMIAAGNAVRAAPFDVMLDRLSGWKRWVGLRSARRCPRLYDLAGQLIAPLARSGLLREDWHFNPHLTLGYRCNGLPFARTVAPIGWRASEFVLIHSLVGETRHELLGRWPLRAQQGELIADEPVRAAA